MACRAPSSKLSRRGLRRTRPRSTLFVSSSHISLYIGPNCLSHTRNIALYNEPLFSEVLLYPFYYTGRTLSLFPIFSIFTQPAEDLILEGSERSVIRVRAGTPYSCLMLKNQRFSSLFRHYAKHHGLRKDDLAYYFTEELQNEDTPETVFLLVSVSFTWTAACVCTLLQYGLDGSAIRVVSMGYRCAY